ncbi:MAG: hypothetical protein IKH01_00850 [Prevotella sp.]|nr:hypothetical protein [Prevotella sp.]
MLKAKEIEIPTNMPFQNCALGREKYANILTDVISYYASEGCVLSINAEWGAGKTTFVKMWQKKLKNTAFSTLYFNAWECDYTTDPLIALLSELEDLHGNQETYQNIASNLGRILWAVTVSAGKQFIKNKVGVDSVVVENTINEISELGEEALKEYKEQQGNLKAFRELLTEYIASSSNGKPVVFFIDELDRCNPTFAVRLLERIKHLFNIPNIIFVLSVNNKQLEYAIQGYYGSSAFNAKEYLRRFIDIEYNLPEPDLDSFCRYLYKRYDFDSFFNNKERNEYRQMQREGDAFMDIVRVVVSPEQITLRDIEQMFIFIRLALNGFAPNSMSISNVFFLLVYWKFTDGNLYQAIVNHKLGCKDLLKEIEKRTPRSKMIQGQEIEPRSFIFVIAQLITSYNLSENRDQIDNILKKQDNSKDMVSVFEPQVFSKAILDDALNCYARDFDRAVPLSYLIQRIELMNNLTRYE